MPVQLHSFVGQEPWRLRPEPPCLVHPALPEIQDDSFSSDSVVGCPKYSSYQDPSSAPLGHLFQPAGQQHTVKELKETAENQTLQVKGRAS